MARSRLLQTVILLTVASAGCAAPTARMRDSVSANLEQRTGYSVGPSSPASQVILPPGLDQGQPLTEEQIVLLALWNNAAFQELLVELQLTRADLVQAGLLPNPEFGYFFSSPDKPFKYLFDFPLEALWLRPVRIRAAERENARAAERLTQTALDLIRDTRQGFADLLLANERVAVADQSLELRGNIAKFAEKRLKAGDASEQESVTAKIDALQAKQERTRTGFDVTLAEERLKNLTGLAGFTGALAVVPPPALAVMETDLEAIVDKAVRTRPDAVSARVATEAAAERLRIAKLGWIRVLGILDATSGRNTGHEFSPALRITLPIFNRNQGLIARAEADLELMSRRQQSVCNQIVLDVRLAHTRFRQATAELDVLRKTIRPEVDASIRRTQKAYEDGNVPLLIALEANRQLIDTLAREAVLKADQRRAWVELERSVGRRLTP